MLIAHCISDLLFQGPAATALGVARTQLSASASVWAWQSYSKWEEES